MDNGREDQLKAISNAAELEDSAVKLLRDLHLPLSSIIRYVNRIRAESGEIGTRTNADKACTEALQASEMLDRAISVVAGKSPSSVEVVDVNQILAQTASLFRHQLKARGYLLDTSLAEGSLPVRVDSFRLQQAFYIALLNAVQLLIISPGARKLTLSTMPDANIIKIEIAVDTPAVMVKDEQDSLKQFFSAVEKGMGAGWYTLNKRIIDQGGSVSVSGGEVFAVKIELPRAFYKSVPETTAEGCASGGDAQPKKRSALIIDDEVMTGKVTAEMMANLGFETTYTDDPMKAPSLLEAGSFDLVFIDYLMPKVNGIALIREHAALLKDSMVVLMTGDSSLEESRIQGPCKVSLLKKPFGFKELGCLAEKAMA